METITDFFKNTTLKEWLFLLFGAILGYLTNLIFYLKSKNDSNEKNLDRLFALYDKSLQQPDLDRKLREIKEEISTKNSLEKLADELKSVKDKIERAPNSENVLKYKIIGDKWSDEYLKTFQPKIITQDGNLFYSNILNFHKTIFPQGFPWAGKTRTQNVIISGSFGTLMPSEARGTVDYNIKPVRHEEIPEKMERFCTRWNSNVAKYLIEDAEAKIETIAKYHHEFQLIHPFIDGNGRIGRIILDDMTEYLLNKKLKTEYIRKEYYNALRFADMGDINPLKQFILKLI